MHLTFMHIGRAKCCIVTERHLLSRLSCAGSRNGPIIFDRPSTVAGQSAAAHCTPWASTTLADNSILRSRGRWPLLTTRAQSISLAFLCASRRYLLMCHNYHVQAFEVCRMTGPCLPSSVRYATVLSPSFVLALFLACALF